MSDRRTILQGLASLVMMRWLTPKPLKAAVVPEATLSRPIAYLAHEHRAALIERYPGRFSWDGHWQPPMPPMEWFPDAPDIERMVSEAKPSSRAAVMLSAAGCPLTMEAGRWRQ